MSDDYDERNGWRVGDHHGREGGVATMVAMVAMMVMKSYVFCEDDELSGGNNDGSIPILCVRSLFNYMLLSQYLCFAVT